MIKRIFKNKVAWVVLGILAVGLVAAALWVKHQQTVRRAAVKTDHPGAGAAGVGSSSTAGSGSPSSPTSTSPQTTSTGSPTSSIGKPSGQLLSNHTVSLSGNSSEESACQTVAGATCDIRLTGPNGTVKTLGAKAVDANGSAIFDWNAASVGLSPGKWTVEAVASKGGDTEVSQPDYLQVNS